MTFAYIHCKPDGTPFYVGKGVRTRHKDFTYRNIYHKRVVAKYGKENILIGKLDCTSNDIALQLEIGVIKCLKRMGVKLTNLTEGGEGNVGWKCPENVKKAVAEANSKRVLTEEQRKKIGQKYLGKKRPEHSKAMKENKTWVGNKNPHFGNGSRQIGAKNVMAKSVLGTHVNNKKAQWETATDAAKEIGVTIQAVVQAIKKQHRCKGWTLGYTL